MAQHSGRNIVVFATIVTRLPANVKEVAGDGYVRAGQSANIERSSEP